MILDNINMLFNLSIYILFISTSIHALELIMIPKDFISLGYHEKYKINKQLLWRLIHTTILITSIISLIVFQVYGLTLPFKLPTIITFIGVYYSYLIRVTGKDGADQFRAISFLILTISFLLANEQLKQVFLIFTALQLLLAYTTSGIIKLSSPYWRKGNVLVPILSTYSFGYSPFSQWLRKHPKAEQLFSYGAIFCMISVFISFFIPTESALIITLSSMLSFHLATTVLMGLNDFVLTLPLAYPGVFFLHQQYLNFIIN